MSWRDEAACRGKDPSLWSPDSGLLGVAQRRRLVTDAIVVCCGCPVRSWCAREVIHPDSTVQTGVWAGIDLGDTARQLSRGKRAQLEAIAAGGVS